MWGYAGFRILKAHGEGVTCLLEGQLWRNLENLRNLRSRRSRRRMLSLEVCSRAFLSDHHSSQAKGLFGLMHVAYLLVRTLFLRNILLHGT
jgi:hypothetical protein